MPRWTTARAVSGGADFRLRVVSPILDPSKERIGRVASSERIRENADWEMGFGLRGLEKERNFFVGV